MNRTPMDEQLVFIVPTNPDEISVLFGRWLLHYFYPWSPGNDTWVDVENNSYYTEELFKLFQQEILKNES